MSVGVLAAGRPRPTDRDASCLSLPLGQTRRWVSLTPSSRRCPSRQSPAGAHSSASSRGAARPRAWGHAVKDLGTVRGTDSGSHGAFGTPPPATIFRPPLDEAATDGIRPGAFDQLLRPSWREIDDARRRYNAAAQRLSRWQWWFVGMFTVYTTLSGILLFNLLFRG